MAKSAKQLFNYAVETVDGETFRCAAESEKEVIVKHAAYNGGLNIDIDVFEKAVKNLNLKEAVILYNTLCATGRSRICSVYIEHTVLYGSGVEGDDE